MYKYSASQNDKQKYSKKPKEIKILSNYAPVKKSHFQPNISEYETETSIQKNFSNKCPKMAQKNKSQTKSVQNAHSKQLSPKIIFTNNINPKVLLNKNKSNSIRGSFYNLNYLKNYNYSNEKKLIDNKNEKINTLKRQLSLYIQQVNLIEKKDALFNDMQNDIKNEHSAKNKNPKILYINKNNNKYLLINNNSYVGFPSNNNKNKIIESEISDKKLEKKLSNFLSENNSDNNYKKNYINNHNEDKNILNIIFQSKKRGYIRENLNTNLDKSNNCEKKMLNDLKNNKKIKKKICFKNKNINNLIGKEKKDNIYFYPNKEHTQKISIMENNLNKNCLESISTIDVQYKTLNERVTSLFNCYFDYYNKKFQK